MEHKISTTPTPNAPNATPTYTCYGCGELTPVTDAITDYCYMTRCTKCTIETFGQSSTDRLIEWNNS